MMTGCDGVLLRDFRNLLAPGNRMALPFTIASMAVSTGLGTSPYWLASSYHLVHVRNSASQLLRW